MAYHTFLTARRAAWESLDLIDVKKTNSAGILADYQRKTDETQRLTDIVLGTLRNRKAIDTIIAKYSGRKIEQVTKRVINMLRGGVFELCFCPQTPEHAIVSEWVNISKIGGSKASGFVNAVFRNVQRQIETRQDWFSKENASRSVWQGRRRACIFKEDIWCEVKKDPAGYLAESFSLGLWLVREWVERFGFDKAFDICVASGRRCSVYLLANTIQLSADNLSNNLSGAGVRCERVGENSIHLKGAKKIDRLRGYSSGFFLVQDITASKAVMALAPKADDVILDMCAAPGGKTCQMAIVTDDRAEIIATDIDAQRLKLIEKNAVRLKLRSINIIKYENLRSKTGKGYDKILIDVPCSNTGVLARRVEARYRVTSQGISRLSMVQRDILDDAAELIKAGGVICYSTCSLCKEENEDQVQKFLADRSDFELLSELLTLPSDKEPDHDGGYYALLKRK